MKSVRHSYLLGTKCDRLFVLEWVGKIEGRYGNFWKCLCDCTNITFATSNYLEREGTKSCGCVQKEKARQTGHKNRTHGKGSTPEHGSWSGCLQRCYNPNCQDYLDYGARGIVVCDAWREKKTGFSKFLEDMGPKPTPKHSLDRINNDGNYEPGNCRWATSAEQAKNKRAHKSIGKFSDDEINAEFYKRNVDSSFSIAGLQC